MTQADEEEPSVAKAEALKNLHTWSTDRKNWKFSKLRQVWLLNHMYDPEMVRSNRLFSSIFTEIVHSKRMMSLSDGFLVDSMS